ncbi:alpha-acetolactate decarboxylase, partial [bacterium]
MVANIYQVAAFEALRVGAYDGTTQVSKLMEHGDFGLGTFNGLNGEMIALEGKVYRISAFGEAHAPEKDVQTPFAFVTRFRADHVHKVTHPLT